MIRIKEIPDKVFSSKEEMFKALSENEALIIDAKKSEIYKSIEKGNVSVFNLDSVKKAFETSKSINFDDDYYYIVVNSANVLDSHLDLHVDGNWNKSVKDQQGKCFFVFDHTLKRSEIIAMKKDIEMFTENIPWSFLGKSYDGETYCLIYKFKKSKVLSEEAKNFLDEGHEMEASVRMQYIKIEAAYNSDNPDYSKQKSVFDNYYPLIVNKDDFEEIDYFWVVKEAKNVMESSLVMFGSNPATGLIENKEQPVGTQTNEPSNDTQAIEMLKELLSKI